ncbi:MAG TPA: hypothetical protein VFI06_05745 [Chitinophagaceae bacterium]|nr:hypothetical protein [Chitinophagaceae bacterium]
MRPRLLAVFIALLISTISYSQRFGGNPPSLKWRQVNTDTARIIFPEGLDSQAMRVASLVHYLAGHPQAGPGLALGNKLYKINIVLQNQTIIPNAYVGLGPYRSEFFLTPPPNNFDQGTISWNDQLVIHEYRHVQQFNNFRRGLSKLMYILFGQEGYSVAINASVPDWFYEGDAVYNETILSRQGRGRIPLFLNAYPSLWQARKNYSWMKLRNGSLKDYVPDHYHLGYLLVNYGREKYGLDFWSKVTADAAAFKGLFYPFQHAIKKNAGISYKTFTVDAFAYYKSLAQTPSLPTTIERQGLEDASVRNIFKVNKKVLTSYLFPYRISPDSLIYLKASNDRRPAFYIKDQDGEHMLRARDISTDQQFSYRNGKLVYAAYETDPRWVWRDYSVIKLLDIHTNTQRAFGHKTKYFSPDLSPSGAKIAAVHVAVNGKSEIHILDAESGEVTNTIKSGDITLFTDPKFIDDASLVCVVRLIDGKTALALADIASGNTERLTTPSYNVVGYPCVTDGEVYFTASYGGNDDVFVLRLSDKKISRVTNSSMGNYFVNAAGGKITWSTFTAEGYQLQEVDEKDIQLVPVDDPTVEMTAAEFPVSHSNEIPEVLLNPAVNRQFLEKKYSKATGLFNFHSWRPYYENPIFTYSLYGENILNTFQSEIYYLYNRNDNTNAAGVNLVYGAWFPYLSIGTQYTFDRQVVVGNKVKQWDQLDSRIGFNIPLTWVSGKAFDRLNFGSSYVYRNDFNKGVNKDLFTKISFSYLSHFINWSQEVQMAPQHIFPRLGYNINFNYRHAITKYKSWQPLLTSSVFLPGALPTHSLVISGAFQETDTVTTLFANRFPYSRGFNEAYGARMWKISGEYHLPIFYPDFGFANILYLQRVRGDLFYDLTRVYSKDKSFSRDQKSFGVEVYVDTQWWNQYPLTFGFRISHLLDKDLLNPTGMPAGSNWFEFILPVSIIPR